MGKKGEFELQVYRLVFNSTQRDANKIQTERNQNTNDPVLFWVDSNLGYGKIKHANVKIREKSKEDLLYRHRYPIDSGSDFWNKIGNMVNYQNRNTWQDAMNRINAQLQQNPNITATYH